MMCKSYGHESYDMITVTVTSYRIGKRKDIEGSGEIILYHMGNTC